MTKARYILGSGIVGLLARELLGSTWKIIPFSKSRFYSFQPSLDDNFIIRDQKIDDVVTNLGGGMGHLMYTSKMSYAGQLFDFNKELIETWLFRLFGNDLPSHSLPYYTNRGSFFTYTLKLNQLYRSLLEKYKNEILEGNHFGKVSCITNEQIKFENSSVGYDQLVSTIPLNILMQLMGVPIELKSKQLWYYHIQTKDLDFEGANRLMIVDDFDFYKASQIAEDRYLICCLRDTQLPGTYFAQFMKRFDMLDGTTIQNALPCGERPNLDSLENREIYCVGGHAQWDHCMDVGSSIMRLLKISGKF